MSDLAAELRTRIAREGYVTVADYMNAVAGAYYARGDVFGAKGDFTTAPEISQTFGEIIGLWCAVAWQQMGQPGPFKLIECGPGRGTLMADLLRAAKQVPSFVQSADIHFVERSRALRDMQRESLKEYSVTWHDDFAAVPPGPSIIIGNEFLDALPIRQFQRTETGWAERVVKLKNGSFVFDTHAVDNAPIPIPVAMSAEVGEIYEYSDAVAAFVAEVSQRLVNNGGAALLIDYGHTASAVGETLQAVKQHQYVAVLDNPGAADLTAHVDFAAVKNTARLNNAAVFGPLEQGTWLKQLGIGVRQMQLARGKPAEVARTIEQGVRRLTEPHGMGVLFKAIALAGPGLQLEGFTT
ncbi:MAG: SAM-dependent methyltransferase [Rhodospirillaceae bacterium]|nr:SAM-dependent methyltransferase [Rhodospirillaceae bacterium]